MKKEQKRDGERARAMEKELEGERGKQRKSESMSKIEKELMEQRVRMKEVEK